MKFLAFPLLCAAVLFGQAPPLPKVTPGTPGSPAQPPSAAAPAPAASLAPDTVVVEIAGKKYTKAEVDGMINSLPPQFQQAARMQPQMLSQIFMIRRMAADGEKAGLDKQSPYKEAIEFNRMQILQQAQATTYLNTIQVTPEDEQKYYKENADKYKQAKVRVIYITFSPTPDKTGADGKKLLSEAEAKAKIDDLRKQALGGADFGKLARENSDDKSSAEKDGDFGMMSHTSSYPDPIKSAVFALKAGEISEPVRQPNGFYLIRVDQVTEQPFAEVDVEILKELRQKRFNDYVKGLQDEYKVKVENPAYFTPQPGAPQLKQVPR